MKDYMAPEAIKFTRRAEIYCYKVIHLMGFKFFDANNSLIFQVGVVEYANIQKTSVDIDAEK
jgi:hypothetical protein